jgi:hypothetical protein
MIQSEKSRFESNKWLIRKGRLLNPPEVDHFYTEFSSRVEAGILKAAGY